MLQAKVAPVPPADCVALVTGRTIEAVATWMAISHVLIGSPGGGDLPPKTRPKESGAYGQRSSVGPRISGVHGLPTIRLTPRLSLRAESSYRDVARGPGVYLREKSPWGFEPAAFPKSTHSKFGASPTSGCGLPMSTVRPRGYPLPYPLQRVSLPRDQGGRPVSA
jgi:hypothetical protein